VVRDLAAELGKEVSLVTAGAETELDKTVIEQLNEPLIHIIRNTIDHEIETPAERRAQGKPLPATIRLSAEHSGSNVFIHIAGDGAGIDTEAIRRRAVEIGRISEDDQLTENELIALIFDSGFSTAKRVSEISGRGVGLDVVKRTVESLGGGVSIESKRGEGTVTTLKLPLTLAIIDGLQVHIGKENFIIPLSAVEECLELSGKELTAARNRRIIRYRGKTVSYLNLRTIFTIGGKPPETEQVVIVEAKDERVGLGIDHVVGQHQTVIKSIGRMYRDVDGISGATILGDGTVALIIDVPRLVSAVAAGEQREPAAMKQSPSSSGRSFFRASG
jgi:two-component system chemotaxis sensor kinase CheA